MVTDSWGMSLRLSPLHMNFNIHSVREVGSHLVTSSILWVLSAFVIRFSQIPFNGSFLFHRSHWKKSLLNIIYGQLLIENAHEPYVLKTTKT